MTTTTILSDNGVSSGTAGIKTTGGNDGTLALQTTTSGGTATTAVTIDTSQNVGVGATPSAWGSGYASIQVGSSANIWAPKAAASQLLLNANGYYDGSAYRYINSNYASDYYQLNGQHVWRTAASGTAGNPITFTQAMTLDSSGNLLVGTTVTSGNGGITVIPNNIAGTGFIGWNRANTASAGYATSFNNNGVSVGTISYTNTATTYSTSSDYRLKENIAPMTGALETVAALKPCTYTWKIDGSDSQGFIAHELAEIIPHAVVGEKDAVDSDGNPIYQGIDTSFLVATLVAAIQELKAEIDELKGAQA